MTAKEYAEWWGVDEQFVVELCEKRILRTAHKAKKKSQTWHVNHNENLLKYVDWLSATEYRIKPELL